LGPLPTFSPKPRLRDRWSTWAWGFSIGNLPGPVKLALVAAAIGVMTGACTAGETAPLPRPRPSGPKPEATSGPHVTPGGTACQLRLTPDRAVFESLGAIAGTGECGGPDIVLLKRVVTRDHLPVEFSPSATLRCETAEAIVDLAGIDNLDSFECRGQNRIVGAKLSEHGRANALDISAIRLKSGQLVRPADPAVSKDFRIAMRASACARFTTVLGPGADGYHEDDIHIDLADRRSGYRIYQWDIRDSSPEVDYAQRSVAGVIPVPRPKPVAAGAMRMAPNAPKRRP
jgi:Extensin-like protein C-terminus